MKNNKLDALVEQYSIPNWRLTAWPAMFFLAFIIIWASFMTFKEVTVASGVFVSTNGSKLIQHPEGGIVEGVHAIEGQVVKMDAPLILIKTAKTGVNLDVLQARLDEQFLIKVRLETEVEGKNYLEYPEELARRSPKQAVEQRKNFEHRRSKLDSSVSLFAQKVKQRSEEVIELENQLKAFENNLRLSMKRFEMSKALLNDGLTQEPEHLQIEAELQSLKVQVQNLRSSVPTAKEAVKEAENQIKDVHDRFISLAQEELVRTEQTIDRIRLLLASSNEQDKRTMIRSPTDGVVKKIMHNKIGEIIRPSETIIEILPTEDTLVIEARLKPIDRAFVVLNQPAIVKLSAYDYVRFGGLDGRVTMVAPVANIDENGEPYFKVLVQTYKSYLGNNPKLFKITPGMQATVDIHTGEKSLIEYLITPVLQLKHKAFRER